MTASTAKGARFQASAMDAASSGSVHLSKRFYDSAKARMEYRDVLSEARQGIALSDEERKRPDAIISPLLLKGQSLYHICLNHKAELMVSERTLYTYMDAKPLLCTEHRYAAQGEDASPLQKA